MNTTEHRKTGIAVLGANYWGSHLIRIFRKYSDCVAIVDPNPKVRQRIKSTYPGIRVETRADVVWNDPMIRAVCIATPSSSHFTLAKQALDSDKHVFVEKPITLSLTQAKELVSLQKKHRTVLMVDHTYLYSAALMSLKKQIQNGVIGHIRGIESIRIGPGIIREDASVLWDLAPHDVSIGMYISGKHPSGGSVLSSRSFPNALTHTAFVRLTFGRIPMTALLSWTSPTKLRQLTVYGSRGALMASWDGPHEHLSYYPTPGKGHPFGSARRINVDSVEPLENAVRHFLECITMNKTPRTDGTHASAVIGAIEKLTETQHR